MKYKIKDILDDLSLPDFREGQLFETLITFFPGEETPRKNKNLTINNVTFTKPLASSKKDKKFYFKEKSPIDNFYNNHMRGDILEVIEIINKDLVKCSNLSFNETAKKYYKDIEITLSKKMLAEGYVKRIQRNVNKAKNEADMSTKDSFNEEKLLKILKDKGYPKQKSEDTFNIKNINLGAKTKLVKSNSKEECAFSKKLSEEKAKNHFKKTQLI